MNLSRVRAAGKCLISLAPFRGAPRRLNQGSLGRSCPLTSSRRGCLAGMRCTAVSVTPSEPEALDEIPQFWNVLKGDMSLVGPRPERPVFCEEFEKRIHGWHYRTKVRPGLRGMAQVKGGYDLLPREKVLLDLKYIETRGIVLDLSIVFKTLGVMGTGEGAR